MDRREEVKPYAEIIVDDWRQAKDLFYRFGRDWIFRGQSDTDWDLSTTFEREAFPAIFQHGAGHAGGSATDPPRYEEKLIEQFKQGAYLHRRGSWLPERLLDWLAWMQHYGAPTRLLDFTRSPYVASYFSMKSRNRAEYRAVWALNEPAFKRDGDDKWQESEFYQNLRREKGAMEGAETAPSLIDAIDNPETFSSLMVFSAMQGLSAIVPVPGRFADERIVAQQGMFVLPTNLTAGFMRNVIDSTQAEIDQTDPRTSTLIKICLPTFLRPHALRDLQLMNITEASLFPGLDGFARSLVPNLYSDVYAKLNRSPNLNLVDVL